MNQNKPSQSASDAEALWRDAVDRGDTSRAVELWLDATNQGDASQNAREAVAVWLDAINLGEPGQSGREVVALWVDASNQMMGRAPSSYADAFLTEFHLNSMRWQPAYEAALWLDAQRLRARMSFPALSETLGLTRWEVQSHFRLDPAAPLIPARFFHAVAQLCGAEGGTEAYQRAWRRLEAGRAARVALAAPGPLRFTRAPDLPPVPQSDPRRAVVWLDAQRRRSRVTLEALAELTGVDKSTVSRILNPAKPKKKMMAKGFFETVAKACGADMVEAAEVYRLASGGALAHIVRAKPAYHVQNFAELVTAMNRYRSDTGNVSLEKLQQAAAPKSLPHTTLARVLSGKAVPTKELLLAFVRACDPESKLSRLSDWEGAWNRCRLDQLLADVRELPSARVVMGMIAFPAVGEMDAGELRRLQDLYAAMEPYVDPHYPPPIRHAPILI